MSSLNVNPEFNTEMEQLTPETRAHADRFNERYGQLLGNDAFLKGKLEDANTNIERAMAVAQGKSAGYVFNTYSELIAYIAVPANAEKFRLGDQFLIKTTDVPDYWWDNTVTTAQTDSAGNVISGKNTSGKIIGALVELEARKIDLSKYDANDAALFNNMSDQYSSARTYDVGDICIHNNDLYKCVTAVEAAETFNASKWNKTSLAALHAEQEKKISENTQSLTNIKKTYLRLVLPNVAADAKAVCDYINKNYLMGQITPMYSIEFDVVASNADWFSGVLSTDSNVDSNARTVWGIVQRRSISADNSTLYKYFGSGAGGAGTVSPFKRYEDGRTQGRNDVIGSPNSYGLYTKAQYDANKVTYKSGNYNTGLNGETWRSTSFNTGFSTIIALQINCWNDEGNGYFNAFKNVRISGGKVSLDFYAADYVNNYVQWLAVGK
jgi:hypothetical protein